jgi:murein DD-endopeptidase MepM/ murein hydrolase activator NlpD
LAFHRVTAAPVPGVKATAAAIATTLAASAPAELPKDRPTPVQVWIHPLLGLPRRLPGHDTRRFGAVRDHSAPPECQAGHCGVDLAAFVGEAVVAVHDGHVERVDHDADGREGRYVRIVHPVGGGGVVSWYMHLDRIRPGLAAGDWVQSGELIGYAGRTGIKVSQPHVHFAVSLRFTPDEGDRYIDPEPLLRRWQVIATPRQSDAPLLAAAAGE